MKSRSWVTLFYRRHALSAGIAILIAVIFNAFVSFSDGGWMILSAFLVNQTTRGTPLRQGLIIFTTLIIAIFVASILIMTIKHTAIIEIILTITFILSGYFVFIYRPLSSKSFLFIMLFAWILLIATLFPASTLLLMRDRMVDVMIGAMIGIACSQWILPVRSESEFRQGMVPILKALIDYSHVLTHFFLQTESITKREVEEKKLAIENILQTSQDSYPEWVYEVGFNPGLRAGFRFFLVHIERIIELFFSLDYFVAEQMDVNFLQELAAVFTTAMQKNAELLHVLLDYFANNQLTESQSDLTSDMTALEATVRRIVPQNLELIEISPDYVALTAITRNVKDIREILLQLVIALPAA